jgi:omega-amidase
VVEDKMENLRNAALQVKKAAEMGADFAVLPEMFNCPYETSNFPIYAETDGGPVYTALSQIARENHLYLIGGSVPEREEDKIYNTCYIFDREGKLLGKHRKVHLFNISVHKGQRFQESETLTAGNQITVLDTEFGKIGVAICFDIRFPEQYRLMALAGAQMIFTPAAFSMTTGRPHWELAFRSRALDNQVFTIGAAPARVRNGNYIPYSHSIIVNPWGDIVTQMGEVPAVSVTEIDLDEVASIRNQMPLLAQMRNDLYEVIAK